MTDTTRTRAGRFDVRAAIAIARIATNKAGSQSAPMVMDRLEPIPPNAVRYRGAEREQDRTEQQYEDDAKKSELCPSGDWPTPARHRRDRDDRRDEHDGTGPKTQLESRGRIRCLAKSCAGRAGADGSVRRPALETTTNLAHESEEERTANGDGRT